MTDYKPYDADFAELFTGGGETEKAGMRWH